jgi:hypothetical protein
MRNNFAVAIVSKLFGSLLRIVLGWLSFENFTAKAHAKNRAWGTLRLTCIFFCEIGLGLY